MSVLMAEISWVEYERRLREEDAIVLVPVGAVEQHGRVLAAHAPDAKV